MLRDNGDFRVCQYASTRRFACAPFLAPKSLRQIGYLWFFRTNSGSADEPLMGGSFFCGERITVEFRVCLIRFNPPFRLRPVFSSKIIAPNRGSWGLGERTPEVLTNLSCGRFVFYWGIEEGIEVLAKPIFVRGVSPFYGWHAPCPLQWKQCRPHFYGNGRL